MTAQTVQTVGAASLPRVNLLPPEIADAARFRRLQMGMGATVLISALAVAGLYIHERHSVASAQTDLQSAQSQQSSLQSKLASLQTVKDTYAAVQAKQQLLTTAMGDEIRWSGVLNDLSLRIPSNVWLTSVQAAETSPAAGAPAPAGSAAGAAPTYGTITFNGVAMAHDDVARWLDAIAKEPGFTQASFSNSTEAAIGTRTIYNFGSSVVLDSDVLSNRYVQKASS